MNSFTKPLMIKAIAVALNPVTVIDLLTGAADRFSHDLGLIPSLRYLNDSIGGCLALLKQIALSMGGISASEFVAALGLSSLKGILGVSAPATAGISLGPYVSVAITQGSIAGSNWLCYWTSHQNLSCQWCFLGQ